MASSAEMADRRMSIGRVFSRAFGTIGAHPALMFGISFLFGALPGVLLNLLLPSNQRTQVAEFNAANIVLSLAVGIAAIGFSIIAQGALVRVTVAHSDGEPVAFGDAALAGLRKIVPLFVLVLLMAVAIGFASLLLIVPGIILYVMWSVAAPVLVAENSGIFGAMRRSAQLTKGARWSIFGLQLILLLVMYTIIAVAGIVAIFAAGGIQNFAAAQTAGPSVIPILLSTVFNTVSITFAAAIQTALYVELRDWKDGPATAALGDIFG
ncbi:hypothetical protein [Sphingomonas sp. HMP6]|uniref:hypothetical protein n=1 Tax=Sphingomonas sp. HMP6 TaxID=1517551 RepID=UPI001596C995|nr:hypothetical protein [Sphingomonas sp. HMP6]